MSVRVSQSFRPIGGQGPVSTMMTRLVIVGNNVEITRNHAIAGIPPLKVVTCGENIEVYLSGLARKPTKIL